MIVERFKAAGSFKVSLDSQTPRSVTDEIKDFALLVVTPVHFPDTAGLSATGLLDVADYTGVIVRRDPGETGRRSELNGYGLPYLLGAKDGMSDMFTSFTAATTGHTISHYVDTYVLKSASTGTNGIRQGTITTSTFHTDLDRNLGDSPLDVLNGVVELLDGSTAGPADWRIRPNLLLDVTQSTALFPPVSSTSALFAEGVGRDPSRPTYSGRVIPGGDAEELTTRTIVVANSSSTGSTAGSTGASGSTAGSTSVYVMGDRLRRERVIKTSNVTGATLAGVYAAQAQNFYNTVSVKASVTIDGGDWVHEEIEPGSNVYVWAEDAGIHSLDDSTTHQVWAGGQTLFPKALIVNSISRPVRRGSGVYIISPTTGSTFFDATQFVEWETGNTKVEMGDPPRRLALDSAPRGR